MPSIAAIPRNNFTTRFEAAKTEILAYFEFAHDIASKFQSQLAAQRLLEEAGKRPRSKRIKAGRICCVLANQLGCSLAYVYQCRSSARAFSDELVQEILAACEAAQFVPTQELFIALTRIPLGERQGWIEAVIKGRWSASKIKDESKRVYGVRSNGGRQPSRPASLGETVSKFDSACSRLHAIFERLSEVQVGVEPPQGITFQVPRSVMTNVADCREALDSLREALTSLPATPARGRGCRTARAA